MKVTYDIIIILPAVTNNGVLLLIMMTIKSFLVAIDMLYHFVLYLQILWNLDLFIYAGYFFMHIFSNSKIIF